MANLTIMETSVVFLYAILCICEFVGCHALDITPTCNDSMTECTTITSFARTFSRNGSSVIILSLSCGNHVLNADLQVTNVSEVRVVSIQPEVRPNLVCNRTAIIFKEINNVTIEGVSLLNCSTITIENADIISLKGLSIIISERHLECFAIKFAAVQIMLSNISLPLCLVNSTANIVQAAFSDITSTLSPISATDCTVTLQHVTFISNHGGVLNTTSSSAKLTEITCHNNSASDMSIVNIANSTLDVYDSLIITKSRGDVIRATHQSRINMSGYINFSENRGSIIVLSSHLNMNGSINASCNHPSSKNQGLFTIYDSTVILTGDTRISSNSFSSFFLHRSTAILTGNVTITDNIARVGAGINAYESDITFMGVSDLSWNVALENGGSIYAFSSSLNFHKKLVIQQCTAKENGGGIYASNSLLYFHQPGHSTMLSNSASNGGGACLTANSKIYLVKYREELIDSVDGDRTMLSVTFINNTAINNGGAIFVQDTTYFATCGASSHFATCGASSQECVLQILQYYSLGIPFSDDTRRQHIYFENNSAQAGATLYGGMLDRCRHSQFAELHWQEKKTGRPYFTQISDISLKQKQIMSGPLTLVSCEGSTDVVFIKQGQTQNFSLVALDQNFNRISTIAFSYLESKVGGMNVGQAIQNIDANCTTVTYNIFTPQKSDNLIIYADGPCKDRGPSKLVIHFEVLPCPLGFQLSATNTSCECHSALQQYTQNCDIDKEAVVRLGGYWISYTNTSNNSGLIVHPHCPYDYCHPPSTPVYVHLQSEEGPDSQCAFNRTGMLCGACRDGYSNVLGSSRCKKCSNKFLALIIPIALAGVILVILILFLNLTVDVGSINGPLLYANIVTTIGLFFKKQNYATVIVSWLNLELGFETCFYNGMDMYSKTWLGLIFPIYLMCLVAMIILISEKSKKFVGLLGNTNPVAVLATLILLSYARLLQTIVAIFSFTIITYPDNREEVLWLPDPNIRYLKGKHLPLCLTGMAIFIAGFLYTVVLTFHQQISHNNHCLKWLDNTRFKSFMDAYHAPFEPKYQGWGGFLLVVRVAVYLGSAFNARGDVVVDLTIVAILIFLVLAVKQLGGKIYKVPTISAIETICLVNLGILTVSSLYLLGSNGTPTALLITSMSLTLVTCLFVIFYHVIFKKKMCDLMFRFARKRVKSANATRSSIDTSNTIVQTESISQEQQETIKAANFVQLREELLDS